MSAARASSGWLVVASVFVLLMANAGLGFYGLAVYLEAITDEQGFTTASVSFATSIFFVISGIAGRLIAPTIERRDVRLVVAAGGVVSAASLLLLGRVDTTWALYATYALFSIGFALSGLVPATTLITRWFHTRRSVALSIASTGLSVGGLTLTQLASWLIDRDGMPDATPVLAVLYLALTAVALTTMWPHPAGRGLEPDGGLAVEGESRDLMRVPYDRAVRSRFFRASTIGFLLALGAQVGAITQLANLGSERVDRATGALAVSAVAFASVVARLIGGVAATRLEMMRMTAGLAALQGLALALLSVADGRAAIVLAAVLFGATVGNILMLQPLVLAEVFGVVAYARIFALNQLIVTAGIAGGPFLLGGLHDVSSYRTSYLVGAAVSVAGATVLAWAGTIASAKESVAVSR